MTKYSNRYRIREKSNAIYNKGDCLVILSKMIKDSNTKDDVLAVPVHIRSLQRK